MATPGKMTYDMNWNTSALSPETQPPELFKQTANGALQSIQLRVNDKNLQAALDHNRSMLDHREQKVAAVAEWLEAIFTCKALGVASDAIEPIRDRLDAETAKRDHLRMVVSGLEKEVARRQAEPNGER